MAERRSTFEPVAFCLGYLRGLAFVDRYAVIGLSRPRHERTFSGLPLDTELARRGAEASCGLQVLDLASGNVVEWVRLVREWSTSSTTWWSSPAWNGRGRWASRRARSRIS